MKAQRLDTKRRGDLLLYLYNTRGSLQHLIEISIWLVVGASVTCSRVDWLKLYSSIPNLVFASSSKVNTFDNDVTSSLLIL